MDKIKIGINGLGRIGRAILKIAYERPEIEIIAGNDLGDLENIAYLLKYDSVYGKWEKNVKANIKENCLEIDNKKIKVFKEADPSKLPWKKLDIDIAVEATGVFESFEKSKAHLSAGAKRVIISTSAKDDDLSYKLGATVVVGSNEEDLEKVKITANGSCTTNSAVPVMAILSEILGIENALLNTIHAYTASQRLVDGPNPRNWHLGRAGAINLIPTSTGAASAVEKAVKNLRCSFDGLAIRIPVPIISLADITFISKKDTTREEVNNILKKAANEPRWNKTFRIEEDPIVSSDLIGDKFASVADLSLTRVSGKRLVKVLVWYENEWGYSNGLVEHIIKAGSFLR